MAVKKVLVLGATGGTGSHIVAQALEKGHEVTVLVRNPERLSARSAVRVVHGNVTEGAGALDSAMRGQDAVISTLGVGNSLKSSGLITRAAPAVADAMERNGIRRLIFTSAYGVGATRTQVPLFPSVLMSLLFRDLYRDKEAGENQLRSRNLDWTLVYPVTLTNGPRTGRYRVGERLELRGLPTISRADVAEFLLTQLDDCSYMRKDVLVSQ